MSTSTFVEALHPREATGSGRFAVKHRAEAAVSLAAQPAGGDPLPAEVRAAVEDWRLEDDYADIWSRYPDVTDAEDDLTDEMDCLPMSRRFVAELASRGIDAVLVRGDDGVAGSDDIWTHWWVRVKDEHGRDVNIDWTVRQFHNTDGAPDLDDLGAPAVWVGDGHPVVDYTNGSVEQSATEH